MDLSDADKVMLEQRLWRSALNSRPAQTSPLNLIRPGPSRGNSFSPSQGGPSLPGGATAPTARGSAWETGSQDDLVKIILNQQRQREQAGVRPRAQPAPGFQVFGQQQLPLEPQQVTNSASLRLGAQMAQLQIGREQSEVSVLGGRGAAPAPSPKFSCTTEGRRRLTFRHLPSSTRGFRLGPNWANCS